MTIKDNRAIHQTGLKIKIPVAIGSERINAVKSDNSWGVKLLFLNMYRKISYTCAKILHLYTPAFPPPFTHMTKSYDFNPVGACAMNSGAVTILTTAQHQYRPYIASPIPKAFRIRQPFSSRINRAHHIFV